MLRVGLTGGMAGGKSAAAARLRELGAYVSQSDAVGRALMEPGTPVFHSICEQFGAAVLLSNGELDRPALARIAFEQGRLEELNALVHPAVIAAQMAWLKSLAQTDPLAVAVVESALIFETRHGPPGQQDAPWRTRFDRIVLVTAPVDLRLSRYAQRAGVDSQAAAADFSRRAAAQWTDDRKSALADFVLRNDGTLQDLYNRVDALYAELRQESADRSAEAM